MGCQDGENMIIDSFDIESETIISPENFFGERCYRKQVMLSFS